MGSLAIPDVVGCPRSKSSIYNIIGGFNIYITPSYIYLMGHSLGVGEILWLCEKISSNIRKSPDLRKEMQILDKPWVGMLSISGERDFYGDFSHKI